MSTALRIYLWIATTAHWLVARIDHADRHLPRIAWYTLKFRFYFALAMVDVWLWKRGLRRQGVIVPGTVLQITRRAVYGPSGRPGNL